MAGKLASPPRRRLAPIPVASDYCGVSDRTIRRYISSGRLPGYRVGPHLIRVDLNELDAMLARIPMAGDFA